MNFLKYKNKNNKKLFGLDMGWTTESNNHL